MARPKLDDLRDAEDSLRSALVRLSDQTREILSAATVGTLLANNSPPPPSDQLETAFFKTARSQDSPTESVPSNSSQLHNTPSDLDVLSLPALPSNWHWITIEQAGNATLGRQRSPRYQHGSNMRPYLRVANVLEDQIDTSDILTMNFDANEFQVYELRRGDILLNEGQSPELVGRPAMYREEIPGACFQNTLIRFVPLLPSIQILPYWSFATICTAAFFGASLVGPRTSPTLDFNDSEPFRFPCSPPRTRADRPRGTPMASHCPGPSSRSPFVPWQSPST